MSVISAATWIYCGHQDYEMDENFVNLREVVKESLGEACSKANQLQQPVDAAHKIRYYMNEFETLLCPKIVSDLGMTFQRNVELIDGTTVDLVVHDVAFIMIKVVNEAPQLDRLNLLKAYNIFHIHSLLRIPGYLVLFCGNCSSIITSCLATDSLASNSLASNSLASNSLASNSLASNSLASNSLASNSLASDSLASDSLANEVLPMVTDEVSIE